MNTCENFNAQICHRFSPQGAGGAVCLRCGHIAACHAAFGAANDAVRFCFFRRDDKTIESCHKKFENPTGKDFVLPVGLIQKLERIAVGDGRGSSFEVPITAIDYVAGDKKINVAGSLKPFYHIDIARMRTELYSAVRNLENDKNLEGFRLVRVYVRPGEWARLTADMARYPQENPPTMESGQVGVMWLDTGYAMVAVFEDAFMPEMVGGRRTICMLEYRRLQQVYGEWGDDLLEIGHEVQMRIVTE